jgi:hypothetical protein
LGISDRHVPHEVRRKAQLVTEAHYYANPMGLLTQLGMTATEAGVSAT